MTTDLAELRKLAEKATPGPWRVFGLGPWSVGLVASNHVVIYEHNHEVTVDPSFRTDAKLSEARRKSIAAFEPASDDAAYIAAANPATILALVSELEALREAVKVARPYVLQAVDDDGGIDNCEVGDRLALERIDAALTKENSHV